MTSLIEARGNYRSAVGPEDQYDLIGGLQFKVLYELGLRDNNRMLDIGCGSLRAGRLFIPYLNAGNYYGIEPDADLVTAGIDNEIGSDLMGLKYPKFDFNDEFNLRCFGNGAMFDFILAHSIFTHAPPNDIYTCFMEAKLVLKPTGKFITTWFLSNSYKSYEGTEWKERAEYSMDSIKTMSKHIGFGCTVLKYTHPSKQKWILFEHIRTRH